MRRAHWSLRTTALSLVALISLAGILLATQKGPLSGSSDGSWPLTWLGWPAAGWMIMVKRPGNRIGQWCLGIGAAMGVSFGLQAFVHDFPESVAPWVELAYTLMGLLPWLVIVGMLNTFPTGTYASRREAYLGRALVVLSAWVLVAFTISTEPLPDTGRPSPLALPDLDALAVITAESGFLLIPALGLVALVFLFLRARQATGAERSQYRWLLLGGVVFTAVAGIGQMLPEDSGGMYIWLPGGMSIPFAIGVAVVRYRLYEIDRILSRTVSYVVVVGLLAAVYFGAVTALSTFLPTDSPVAVAVSTLAVAASFNPLRRRVQQWVDRRFNRSRYDAVRVVERFVGTLQDRADGDEVVTGWVGVVAETMQPATVGVWIRNGSGTTPG